MVHEDTLKIIDTIPDSTTVANTLKKALAPFTAEVCCAFLFGSYACGEADQWSDIDVGIYFADDVDDEGRNRIRFAVMDAVAPLEAQIAYLDSASLSPSVFFSAVSGIPLMMNDEDACFEQLMKYIHLNEEMRLHGFCEED